MYSRAIYKGIFLSFKYCINAGFVIVLILFIKILGSCTLDLVLIFIFEIL